MQFHWWSFRSLFSFLFQDSEISISAKERMKPYSKSLFSLILAKILEQSIHAYMYLAIININIFMEKGVAGHTISQKHLICLINRH